MTTKKLFKNICCAAVCLLVCAFIFGVGLSKISAFADDNAALRIDFSDSDVYSTNGSVTNNNGLNLAPSASVQTKDKFTDFLMYADITVESGAAIEVSFGNGKTLKFTSADAIETALVKTGGSREFAYSDFSSGGIIMIEVMGTSVTVGVSARIAPEEFLYQPVAIFSSQSASGVIKIATDSQTNANINYINIYSLSSVIEIEPDNYEESDGQYPVKPAKDGISDTTPEKGLNGWVIALIAAGSVVVVAGVAVAVLFVVKSKNTAKSNKGE